MEITEAHKRISECGRKLASASISPLTKDSKIHPPTLVAANARMSGHWLFRSLNINVDKIEPGNAILSIEANQKTPVLIQTCSNVLITLGHKISNEPPSFEFLDSTKSQMDFLETQRTMGVVFGKIRAEFQLNYDQAAKAAAVSTAIVIHTVAKNFDVTKAFGLACFSFFEGAKTVPLKDFC